jgi:hypothetical protein
MHSDEDNVVYDVDFDRNKSLVKTLFMGEAKEDTAVAPSETIIRASKLTIAQIRQTQGIRSSLIGIAFCSRI